VRPIIAALALSQLLACATSPEELRRIGEVSTHELSRSGPDAERCLILNAEAFRPPLGDPIDAVLRLGQPPGRNEVLVQNPVRSTLAIAEVVGSRVTIWLSPYYAHKSGLRAAMLHGC
jgi:hypothetical protein